MTARIKEAIFDTDTWKVTAAAILPNGLSLTDIDTALRIVLTIVSISYVLRKILKPKKNDEDTET